VLGEFRIRGMDGNGDGGNRKSHGFRVKSAGIGIDVAGIPRGGE